MESVYVGFLSIIPPILAITLALITKEVISALLVGILSGTVIYAFQIGGNPIVQSLDATFYLVFGRMDVTVLINLALLGCLITVVTKAGGQKAFGEWLGKKIKSRNAAMVTTSALGVGIFFNDFFSVFTIGAVMKPLTDKYKISRAKLAYILDATAGPVCILVPMGTWLAAVVGCIPENGYYVNELAAFVSTIPFDLYAILAIILVFIFCIPHFDFGPMREVELKVQEGYRDAVDDNIDTDEVSDKGTVMDMLIPIGCLIAFSFLFMLETGGFWGEHPGFLDAMAHTSSVGSLIRGAFCSLIVAFFLYVPRKILSFQEFFECMTEGAKSMTATYIILILAWAMGGVCRELLMTGAYISHVIEAGNVSMQVLPAVVFLVGAVLSFATGTSWGCFAILIPIVFLIFEPSNPEMLPLALGATLSGSIFGDHCSPISDTTIVASASAGCNHIEHVSTQLPYALVAAGVSTVGFLVGGFSNGNIWLTIGVSLVLLLAVVYVLKKVADRHKLEEIRNERGTRGI